MSVNMQELNEWYKLQEQLDTIKAKELEMRKRIFGAAFPNPTEGSKDNKLPLAEGWILQGDYKINRKVDEATVHTLNTGNTAPLVDKLFNFKPTLILKEWKALSPEDLVTMADAVTETPGTPSLKIVLPKR